MPEFVVLSNFVLDIIFPSVDLCLNVSLNIIWEAILVLRLKKLPFIWYNDVVQGD